MTTLAEQALAAARRHGAGGLEPERIDRMADDAVLLTLRAGGKRRWLRFDGERVETLSPAGDVALPIAAHLGRLAAEGPLGLLAYRPGRRLALRHGTGASARILKAYRRKRLAGAVHRHATAALAAEGTLLRVPALAGRDDALGCFAMEDLGRDRLQLGQLSPEWFARVGRALRAFQRAAPDVELPLHGLADELAVLDRAADTAVFLTGVLPAGWALAREQLGRATQALEPRPPVLTHRDLHDGQLVPVRDAAGAVGVLDFDLLCRADACLDLANLAAHLELRALQRVPGVTSGRARGWARALRAGHGTADSEPHLRALGAATFLRLALVYHLRPPWVGLVAELVRRAGRFLEEVPHRV